PGDDAAVVEAHNELGPQLDGSANTFDDADDVGRDAARRHEVEHADRAVRALPRRLEDERVLEVALGAERAGVRRREQPAAVVRVAEQRGEARAGVEARETEP